MTSGGRKGSTISDVTRITEDTASVMVKQTKMDTLYPFSHVLRLRVLQVVCSISSVVMGAVACIENKEAITKLGLGVPAGLMTVLAAGTSIHTSRGFGGYRVSTCSPGSLLRVFGPNFQVAIILTLFWSIACSLQIALFSQAVITIHHYDKSKGRETSFLVAIILLILSSTVLVALILVIRIDCLYDPD